MAADAKKFRYIPISEMYDVMEKKASERSVLIEGIPFVIHYEGLGRDVITPRLVYVDGKNVFFDSYVDHERLGSVKRTYLTYAIKLTDQESMDRASELIKDFGAEAFDGVMDASGLDETDFELLLFKEFRGAAPKASETQRKNPPFEATQPACA